MTSPIDAARDILRARFGHDDLRDGQRRAVAAVLATRDVLAVMPTGGGKSLCYQLPALVLGGLTVVLSPLISLMKDQVGSLRARGIAAAALNGSMSDGALADSLADAARGRLSLLFAAPERFESGMTARIVARQRVSLLAVDEAHCISEWGHEFRPSYRRIGRLREELRDPPVIALTATATPQVRRDICAVLRLRDPAVIVTGFDRPNLRYEVRRFPSARAKDDGLLEVVRQRKGPAIVFTATRGGVERLAARLSRARQAAVPYHAGLGSEARRAAQDQFMSGQTDLIVATNAFGMGVDKSDVRLVVHHSIPPSLESYYQEAGRAGRDGKPSRCVLLNTRADRQTHDYFVDRANPSRPAIAAVYNSVGNLGAPLAELGQIAAGCAPRVDRAQVESALRILAEAGAVSASAPSGDEVFVRLLAVPARVRRELGRGPSLELGLLRAIWRLSRGSLAARASIRLADLPPGLGDARSIERTLGQLQDRQILTWSRPASGWRALQPDKPLDRLPIDWHALDRRREAAVGRLAAMERYVRTEGCRRALVLEWFGERPRPGPCGACDNCDPR